MNIYPAKPPRFEYDLTGQTFHHWTVVSHAGFNGHMTRVWNALCRCGAEAQLIKAQLARPLPCRVCRAGKKARPQRHAPTYKSWCAMKARCNNPNSDGYKYYGGRGIEVCHQWNKSYAMFLRDMGERPDGMTLERKDSNGNYEPGNCKWATRSEQNRNKGKPHHGPDGKFSTIEELKKLGMNVE